MENPAVMWYKVKDRGKPITFIMYINKILLHHGIIGLPVLYYKNPEV